MLVQVYDKQKYSANVLLGSIRIPTDSVLNGAALPLTWHHLYEASSW